MQEENEWEKRGEVQSWGNQKLQSSLFSMVLGCHMVFQSLQLKFWLFEYFICYLSLLITVDSLWLYFLLLEPLLNLNDSSGTVKIS